MSITHWSAGTPARSAYLTTGRLTLPPVPECTPSNLPRHRHPSTTRTSTTFVTDGQRTSLEPRGSRRARPLAGL